MILATIEPPTWLGERFPVPEGAGAGQLIEARVCRQRRKAAGDLDAIVVSEAIPFLEYELMRQLMLKLKVAGLNAAFSVKSQIQVGNSSILGTITATGVFLRPLPPPALLRITRTIEVKDDEDRR